MTDLPQSGRGYGIEGERIDGMNVLEVRERVSEHTGNSPEEGRPSLVEAFTYRLSRPFRGPIPEVYREKSEVEEWRGEGPIENPHPALP